MWVSLKRAGCDRPAYIGQTCGIVSKLCAKELSKEASSPVVCIQVRTDISHFVDDDISVGKCYRLLARSQRQQLSHERPPKSFHSGLSHRSMPSRLTSLIRNGLKTTSFTLSATSSVSPVRPQNRLGPQSEPNFRFRFSFPPKARFRFRF